MKLAHVLAVLAAGGVAWWAAGHPGYESQEQYQARVQAEAKAEEAAKPKLYRWHDRNGVLQLTDTPPPKGRKYVVVDTDAAQDVNVIPMSEATNPPEPAKAK